MQRSQKDIQAQIVTKNYVWDKKKIGQRVVSLNLFVGWGLSILQDIINLSNPRTIYSVSWPIKLSQDTYAIQYYTLKWSGHIKEMPKLAFVKFSEGKLSVIKEEN